VSDPEITLTVNEEHPGSPHTSCGLRGNQESKKALAPGLCERVVFQGLRRCAPSSYSTSKTNKGQRRKRARVRAILDRVWTDDSPRLELAIRQRFSQEQLEGQQRIYISMLSTLRSERQDASA
jgi:hypothetical protein